MKNTQSISKNNRFQALYRHGKSNVSPYFAIYRQKNPHYLGYDNNFLGITVTTKLGNAVTRNKIRRRIKEIYRLKEDELKLGFHIVIVARNAATSASYHKLEQSLWKLFDQVELSSNPKFPPKYQNKSNKNTQQNGKNIQGKPTKKKQENTT